MEAMSLFSEIARILLDIRVPLFLLPALTWIFFPLALTLKSRSSRVENRTIILFALGVVLLFWLYALPLLRSPFFPIWELARLFTVNLKHAIEGWFGKNLIMLVDFEVGAVRVVLSFTHTKQKWLRRGKKWLSRVFWTLFVVGIAIRIAVATLSGTYLD